MSANPAPGLAEEIAAGFFYLRLTLTSDESGSLLVFCDVVQLMTMKATARNGQLLIPRHFWPRHDPRYSLARRAGRCRRVSLASKLSAEDGARLTLGYIDPATLNTEEWKHREAEGILYIPKAGQI